MMCNDTNNQYQEWEVVTPDATGIKWTVKECYEQLYDNKPHNSD